MPIYHCHAHCFTIDHVPDSFAKPYPVKIKWLRRYGTLKWVTKNLPEIIKRKDAVLNRLVNLLRYSDYQTQEEIIRVLQSYYPIGTKFVLLTMDMDYMDGGMPPETYQEQLRKLAEIKRVDEFRDLIFPFIFVDPRRNGINELVADYLTNQNFQGIKLYPPVGYYPFDKGLMAIYDFALQNNVPILTHTIRGVVHYRGKKQEIWNIHPVTGNPLPEKKPSQFSGNFTHPLNYECLLNQKLLQIYFDKEGLGAAPDLSKLKICLAHFGGDNEWKNFLHDPWLPDSHNVLDTKDPYRSLDVSLWNKPQGGVKYSWFSIVCDLIKKYENVYADISYTLADKSLMPLLKVALSDPKIRKRVLFGTDFYVVAKETTEREFSVNLRAELGEDLFHQIAYINPREYLASKLNPNV